MRENSPARRQRAKLERKPVRFQAIPSDPCFELWFLIHFQALSRAEARSSVQRALLRYVPDYEKSLRGMWARTNSLLPAAASHAALLRKRREESGASNPSTDADLLVSRLLDMKEPGLPSR